MGVKNTLTERQRQFCRLCAAGMEPRQAAKALGYRNIGRSVRDMLGMEKIQREIQRQKEQAEKPTAGEKKQPE